MRALIALAMVASVAAADTTFTESEIIETQQIEERWELDEIQWSRYQELLNSPQGYLVAKLDPLIALGSDPTITEAERQEYADKHVRAEHARVDGLLKFQRLVRSSWERQFPVPVKLSKGAREVSSKITAIQFELYVNPDDDVSNALIKSYLKQMPSGKIQALHIFLSDTGGDDSQLLDYISRKDIPINYFEQGLMTINHGGSIPEPHALMEAQPNEWVRVQ